MFIRSARQFESLARNREADQEASWVVRQLRASYGESVEGLSEPVLRREVEACLQRCDALGISKSGDRIGFCFLDIVGFPGFRDRPELPALIARCSRREGALLAELCLLTPPEYWVRLRTAGHALRASRDFA